MSSAAAATTTTTTTTTTVWSDIYMMYDVITLTRVSNWFQYIHMNIQPIYSDCDVLNCIVKVW